MTQGMTFKRGDTLSLSGRAPTREGGYAGWALACQVRVWGPAGPADLIADLQANFVDAAAGTLLIQSVGITSGWRLGDAVLDLRYVAPGGARTTTDYVRFRIVEPATQGDTASSSSS